MDIKEEIMRRIANMTHEELSVLIVEALEDSGIEYEIKPGGKVTFSGLEQ